jgi:hypothetical protein
LYIGLLEGGGSKLIAAEVTLKVLDWANSQKATNSAVDALLHMMRYEIVPAIAKLYNEEVAEEVMRTFPQTLYHARKLVLGPTVKPMTEVHMCPNGCEIFSYSAADDDYQKDMAEACEQCGAFRYDQSTKVATSVLRYVLVSMHFPVFLYCSVCLCIFRLVSTCNHWLCYSAMHIHLCWLFSMHFHMFLCVSVCLCSFRLVSTCKH